MIAFWFAHIACIIAIGVIILIESRRPVPNSDNRVFNWIFLFAAFTWFVLMLERFLMWIT